MRQPINRTTLFLTLFLLFYSGGLFFLFPGLRTARANAEKIAVSATQNDSKTDSKADSKIDFNTSSLKSDSDIEKADIEKAIKEFNESEKKFTVKISKIKEKLEKIGLDSVKPVERSKKILPGIVEKMNQITEKLKKQTKKDDVVTLNLEYSELKKRTELARIAAEFEKQYKKAVSTIENNSVKSLELARKYNKNILSRGVKLPEYVQIIKSLDKSFNDLSATIDKDFVLIEKDKKNIAVEIQRLPVIKNTLTDASARDLSLNEQKRYFLDLEAGVVALGLQACEVNRSFVKKIAQKVSKLYNKLSSSREYQALELKKERDIKKSLEQEYLNEKVKIQKKSVQQEKKMAKAREKLQKAKKVLGANNQGTDSEDFDELAYARMKKAEYELQLAGQTGKMTELKEKLLVSRIEYQEDRVRALKLYKDSVDGKLGGPALDKAKKILLTRIDSLKKGISAIEENFDDYNRRIAVSRASISSDKLIANRLEKESSWKGALALKELNAAASLLDHIIENNQKLMGLEKEIQQVLKDNIFELDKLRNTGNIFLLWGNTKDNFLYFFSALAGVICFSILFTWLLKILTVKVFNRTSYDFDEFIANAMFGPVIMLIIILGSWMSLRFLYIAPVFYKRIYTVFESLAVLNVTYICVKVLDVISFFLEKIVKKTATKLDDQLLPLARKTLKTLVVFAGLTILFENLGYRVTSLVTGLGIGGLAFALAAKDTLSNLFGSIMIFTDKPFVIGDWVIFNGFEGIIEDIGIRSTKVRTWKDTMITVPNSTVANASIENVSRFRSRRISTTLKLRINTPPEKIKEAVDLIRNILDSRPDIQSGHYIFYTDIDDYSHNLMIYYFALSTVWRTYLEVRQSVFITILEEFEKRDIHLAVPTELKSEIQISDL